MGGVDAIVQRLGAPEEEDGGRRRRMEDEDGGRRAEEDGGRMIPGKDARVGVQVDCGVGQAVEEELLVDDVLA